MQNFTVSTIDLSFRFKETAEGRENYSRNPITDPSDPRFNQTNMVANVYTIPGVNGGRPVSIMALVMALCMGRAIELETRIIEMMSEMEANSDELERLTKLEETLLEEGIDGLPDTPATASTLTKDDIKLLKESVSITDFTQPMGDILDDVITKKNQFLTLSNFTLYSQEIREYYANLATKCAALQAKIPNSEEPFMDIPTTIAGRATMLGEDAFIKEIDQQMDSLNSFSQQTMIDLQSLTNKRDQSYDMASNVIKSLNTTLVAIANNL